MKIDELLAQVHTVCITGHVHPDGDCAGSTLALYSYIHDNYPALDVDLYLDHVTDKLAFLHHYDDINSECDNDMSYDLMFCIDSASLERIGKAEKYHKTAKKTVNVDHHISNTHFCDINIVEPESSSACEVLYGLMDEQKIDRNIAICLYTGILYDTGVFKYSCTSSRTMEIIAKLMQFDIPCRYIIDESFYAKSYNENRIYGYAILQSKLAFDDKVIYSYITKETMDEFHVTKADLDGIVSQLLLTRGVECSVFVYDIDDDCCKVSLRSVNYLDVNKIAVMFGGGGHVRAAGCNIHAPVQECLRLILDEVGKSI